jgi:hypothetical protein
MVVSWLSAVQSQENNNKYFSVNGNPTPPDTASTVSQSSDTSLFATDLDCWRLPASIGINTNNNNLLFFYSWGARRQFVAFCYLNRI